MFINFILLLKTKMNEATAFGWFHLLWIGLSIFAIFFLYQKRNTHSEKQLKTILAIYAIPAALLEVLKQLSWSCSIEEVTQLITWDYQWYAFPFQLCTTPIYVCLIALFLKKSKLRDALLSYLAFITILGGISTILLPDSCLIDEILINIHTMWLHCGSFVVSVYLLFSKEFEISFASIKKASLVFIVFCILANTMNILVYNSGILQGETFDMFYISPYFISSLPVFDTIQQNVPYVIFLLLYVVAILLGASIIYGITYLCTKRSK